MESRLNAKKGPEDIEPSVFRVEATPEEQIEYFTEERRKAAVPREIELTDPENMDEED
ncbi:hypothetical protein GCM10009715_35300 [Paeniglutamicibacter psychrophenolicus]|uniref:YfhD family protein n=1 Tax=Paeniglutamicibacter psychrophenolicus TaxID=257454 RepID=A0ABS4WB24_9MICC|nr:hypothetical protein [Paeniglutamicibacter psychrophenolicus]MBP2373118.1 hypothetical protein [Paeniglutamicibacter psychrophenolicus]